MIYRKILIPAVVAVALTGCNDKSGKTESQTQAVEAQPQATEVAQKNTGLETLNQRYSYAMGARLAEMLRGQMDASVDQASIAAAITDVFSGAGARMGDREMKDAIVEYTKIQQQAKIEAGKVSLAKGEAFLAENAGKEGVKTLDSGLQYKEVTAGKGDSPVDGDTVKVDYKGSLIDGTEFDSSYKRGEPTSFPVAGVIPGFKEALMQMKPGGKSIAYIPSKLGYGAKGAGDKIGPNETLVFEIELLEVTPAK